MTFHHSSHPCDKLKHLVVLLISHCLLCYQCPPPPLLQVRGRREPAGGGRGVGALHSGSPGCQQRRHTGQGTRAQDPSITC